MLFWNYEQTLQCNLFACIELVVGIVNACDGKGLYALQNPIASYYLRLAAATN